MSALRSAGFPACGFWGHSCPQVQQLRPQPLLIRPQNRNNRDVRAITGGRILEPPPKARGNGARLCAQHHSSTTTTSSSCSPRRKRLIVLRTAGRQKSLRGDRRNFVPLPGSFTRFEEATPPPDSDLPS